jgi:magnesium-transporting ATPase (P-type)
MSIEVGQETSAPAKTARTALGIYAAVAFFLVEYIPYKIPSQLTASDSYTFGYNNRVGMALILVFTAIGAFFYRNEKLQPCSAEKDSAVSNTTFWTCLLVSVALSIAIYVATRPLGSYGESTYLIDRIELTARGLLPYRDFEFAYGVGFLYLPLAVSRILHCSIPNGYYLFWISSVRLKSGRPL